MIWTVLLLAAIFVATLFFLHRRPSGLPPGEWGWPIVGAMPRGNVPLSDLVAKYKKKHGAIFSWKLGSRTVVVLCDFKTIKKAYNHPALVDRPDFYTFDSFSNFKKLGMSNTNGIAWQNLRRFSMRHLRDLGFGKSSMEEAIQFEAQCFLKDLEKHIGEPIEIPWSLNTAMLNIIWQLAASKRFDIEDKDMIDFLKLMNQLFKDFQGPITYFDFFPWLIPITPHFMLKKMRITDYFHSTNLLKRRLQAEVDEHKANLDEKNPRDFIDHYLIHLKTNEGNPENTFSEEDLVMVLADFFTAGSETTASTLKWAFLYLALCPEVQKKVQQEVDEHIPRDTMPAMADRDKLCYTEAMIYEIQRLVSITPLGIAHQAAEDTMIDEYRIPKGTILMTDAIGCHFDPQYWEKSNDFYPEHFLSPEGKLATKKDGYLPFSIGRRICPGESFSMVQQFIFLASFLQRFNIACPEGATYSLERDKSYSIFNFPKLYKLVITKRE